MTRNQISSIALALGTLFTGHVMAAENGPVTRAQVKAELAEAVRTGNVIVGDTGQLMKDVFPQNYPAHTPSTVTRAQVRAEQAEANRTGNESAGDIGHRFHEVFPERW